MAAWHFGFCSPCTDSTITGRLKPLLQSTKSDGDILPVIGSLGINSHNLRF